MLHFLLSADGNAASQHPPHDSVCQLLPRRVTALHVGSPPPPLLSPPRQSRRSIFPTRSHLHPQPFDLCQPQLIKSDTSSENGRRGLFPGLPGGHFLFFSSFFFLSTLQSRQRDASLPHVLDVVVILPPIWCCLSNKETCFTPPVLHEDGLTRG